MASSRISMFGLAMLAMVAPAMAQTAVAADPTIVIRPSAEIAAQAKALMDQAKSGPTGLAITTLNTYPGHSVMMVARTKTGPSEIHLNWNDVFIVMDGEATEVTGGTMVEGKLDPATGETRGARLDGGTRTHIAKGDLVHIPPNTPHWTIMDPGQTLTLIVVKVAATAGK